MVLFPNCKINLGLDIIRRRPDGYHDIETVMIPVPWCDILEIVPAPPDAQADTLTVTGNTIDCPPRHNLVMKAVAAVRRERELPYVDIHLHKIIPDGAGLGGGSSDAAHTIIALDSLFELRMSDDRKASIAAGIGSDCPFFIYNRPMLASGTGTELRPVDISLGGMTLIIAKPENVAVSTARAYAGVTPAIPEMSLAKAISAPISDWTGTITNNFEKSVFEAAPEIRQTKTAMERLGAAYTAMSGSGAAVFGLFNESISPDIVTRTFPGCTTFSCTMP
ncbi:MAG: 4-(cytidine 5'-diphospho)-2-C-methyl-D-erythritol kinase [Bacteroidales bacterium]|nr:4-(cytidine 5'-diphospho)-2-C-methyl-D-erythritol kinase [Bacteroidales bacterium]